MNKKRIKIGIFMDNFYPTIDGVVLVIDNLAKMLAKFNDVVVVVPYTDSINEDFTRPYKIVRIASYKIPFTKYRLGKNVISISRHYKELLEEKFDVIHIHSPFTIGKLGVKIAKDLNIPCIATMHTRFDFEIRRIVDNKLIVNSIIKNIIKVYNNCDKCIAVNHAMINVFKDYGYKYEPVVIYNGTDLLPLKDKENNLKIVNKLYDLEDNEILLLFVGRIVDIKNIFFILDSLKLLCDDGFKFKMMYVGDGFDLKKLKQKIHEYNMDDIVITPGKVTDRIILSSIYARASLFLFPSLFDASSLVQIEAAVNETPGLFIEGSVTSDTVINNVNGFTSKLDTVIYKDRIKEILSNYKLLAKVSKNAKEMLGKNWDTIANETYDLYINEIEKRGLNAK